MDLLKVLQLIADYFSKIDWLAALAIGYLFARWKFKFESIHKRRLEVIEEAYSKLKLASMAFQSLTSPRQEAVDPNEEEKKKERDLVEKVNDMLTYLNTKRLFFSSEELKNIDAITEKLKTIWNDYRCERETENDPSSQKGRARRYKDIWDSTSK